MEDTTNKNEFPFEVFPLFFRNLILEFYKSLNYPIDYSAVALLSAISVAMGTSVKIKVKSLWYEFAPLYCCLIGNAGANKTHPISTLFEPLKNIDIIYYEIFIEQYKKFKEYENLSKVEKKKTDKILEPLLKKHILTNFTPEVLFKRLSQFSKGCIVISDELVTFLEIINNYSKSDQIGIYLSLWNNQSTTIDRVGEPIPMLIKTPFLSIIGGIQPRILPNAFPLQKINNGFYQRFLFAFPNISEKQPFNENEIDESLINQYSNFIKEYIENNIVVEQNGFLNSRTLEWTKESKLFFMEWNVKNCNLINEYSDTIKSEILNKFDNHFIRLAMILQIMENPKSTHIEMNAVLGAEKLCLYFKNCSFKALEILQNPDTYLKSLAENKRKLYNALNLNFTTAEAVSLGVRFELAERRTKEFLSDEILFKRLKHGTYEKKIANK
ncbi:DUF3987 domain-containing protein [Flavobacterium psychrophilum]|uniref:DUF3987 domain-containing protein n=1 Tax=Flavobacterium psychrophilum TaxID=96345 RepID=UPI001C8F4A8C|nr:DUF3987 domain-containing protein [Flavobacterium psychrophilum]EKT3972897.1 DUF3987 domain-containing protein [Flavobacterium psychrophilum]EKT4499572.1 DUF3987 domain-containing protein [Flavobacterium psychrophilum]EKT4519240.1 DUF3987 domain-containing protein [Flavobacterium psychrophilum]EKT4535624.1 DUF3987 domain-containing protein [Flavobacterium psychrophilum]EKT4569976.1 DUF3987 domain-containing protein [Flavobacterium psychrophilum]